MIYSLMKKDHSALNFSEKERACEIAFARNAPYWHLYTDGAKMQNIFCCEEDFKLGMWCLATSLHLCKGVQILTFEIMNNHIHLIMSGTKDKCIQVFELFVTRIKHGLSKTGRIIDWKSFNMDFLPIENLRALRNEIIYVNRNAFVANSSSTPESYPWGGGCASFSPWIKLLKTKRLKDMPIRDQRKLLRTREVSQFSELLLLDVNGTPFIPSFCNIELGESMFRDARNYFCSLTRNAEAFSQIAARLKDSVFLTDEELYAVTSAYISKEFSTKTVVQLTGQQKIDTARHLRFNYNASNQQLRRLLRMELSILEELFP